MLVVPRVHAGHAVHGLDMPAVGRRKKTEKELYPLQNDTNTVTVQVPRAKPAERTGLFEMSDG
jgi:hypothetical protein